MGYGRGGDAGRGAGRSEARAARGGRPEARQALQARGDAGELSRTALSCDGRGYPSLKSLAGTYRLGDMELRVDHVQGDPFASPSRLSVFVPMEVAGFPGGLWDRPHRARALADLLLRRMGRSLAQASRQVGGSGKSGVLSTAACPGPEVLERSACSVGPRGVLLRLEAGLPAHGRTVDGRGVERILCSLVPGCARGSLLASSLAEGEARAAVDLADDQLFVRGELERLGLVAFVADGSVLPRESGVSSLPMPGALPFSSPDSLRVTLDLPHRGPTPGMGVPRGVTLVVGGGYHGKTTLLRALQEGVYDHVAGDGRELVLTDDTAFKLRAEDGRRVTDVDVSPFISRLPGAAGAPRDTSRFSTHDASGSTSQAASLVEAVDAGARVLLVDEDTCASNFMVRDALMASVVSRDHEPITPFVERVRELWERRGVSSVIVAGSSGAFFFVADAVLQMDRYRARDITREARAACEAHPADRPRTAPAARSWEDGADEEPGAPRLLRLGRGVGGRGAGRPCGEGGRGRGDGRGAARPSRGDGRVKVRAHGLDQVEVGPLQADLRLVEQLVDPDQVQALGQMLRWALTGPGLSGRAVSRVEDDVWAQVSRAGLAGLSGGDPGCRLALPRPLELDACLNRLRG